MKAIAPQRRATWHDAYDSQMALWRWTRSENGIQWLADNFRATSEDIPSSNERSKDLLADLYYSENKKLFSADPFFISEEMCEVVDAAKDSFKPEPLLPSDLLSAYGFMYFEKPFDVRDRFNAPMTIAAVSWLPIVGESDRKRYEEAHGEGNVLGMLQQRDYSTAWDQQTLEQKEQVDGLALTIYSTTRFNDAPEDVVRHLREIGAPQLLPTHLTPWWFGMTFDGNEVDSQGKPTGAGWWWKITQTTLRLMQQTLSSRYNMRPDKNTRREGTKRGFHEREVVVVRLRREKSPGNEEPQGEANYSHRFIVGGHWRNQWYPSANVHRQIFISPYVKGPKDAPLVVRPRRVFNWSR